MNGRMVPGSVTLLRDGKQVSEFQLMDYTVLNEIEPSEFARPKQ